MTSNYALEDLKLVLRYVELLQSNASVHGGGAGQWHSWLSRGIR